MSVRAICESPNWKRLSKCQPKCYHKSTVFEQDFLMPQPLQILASFVILLAAFCGVLAQTPKVIPAIPSTQIFPLSQVKEGMRGTARTVFSGTEPEEFGVEILGIVPDSIGPHQDLIIGKLSGALAMRTFVFAGMSGSPVYIDGKLVGAISYSFPFAKEPICGITPIEQMISIFEKNANPKPLVSENRVVTTAELQANIWNAATPSNFASERPIMSGMSVNSALAQVAGQRFMPIATPVTFAGISQATLDIFAPELTKAGIMPVAAIGAVGGGSRISTLKKADATTLVGGDSVVVQLARGDVSIAAAGTVTLRVGDKIYAFGHPYFGLGSTDLPMNESHVVTVVPNANNSFKLAVADATVGSLKQDRATGIFGVLGQTPRMLPVKLKITTSRGRNEEINFESAIDDFLTPLIVNVGMQNSIGANERGLGDTTIEVQGEISVRGEESVKINRKFTGPQAAAFAASAPAIPIAALLKSNFEGLDITAVTLNLSITEGSKTAALERIAVDRTQVRADDTLNVSVFSRTDSGRLIEHPVSVIIPKDAPVGPLSVVIGDGNAVQENAAIKQFVPKGAAELIKTINAIKRPDRLYAILFRTNTGAIVGVSEMPNLPPSVLATMNNDRTVGGSKPSTQKLLIEMTLPASDYIVTGLQTIAIEVVR